MSINNITLPTIKVYSPDKRVKYGVVTTPINLTEAINFNAASEIQFSVAEKYYDREKCEWVKNPIYDKLVEDNLLYIPDDKSYFSFPRFSCAEEDIAYELESDENLETRVPFSTTGGFDRSYTPNCKNFTLQPETQLFDIGSKHGYSFTNRAYLGTTEGGNKGVYCHSSQNDRLYRLCACDAFIPVNKGDVVSLISCDEEDYNKHAGSDTELKKWTFSYHICYYTEMDSTTVTHETPEGGYINDYIPRNASTDTDAKGKLYKYIKNDNDNSRTYMADEYGATPRSQDTSQDKAIAQEGETYVHPSYRRFFPDVRIAIKDQLGGAESGYMRVSLYVACDNAYTTTEKNEDNENYTSYHWTYPASGYVTIYSGERRCSSVQTAILDGKFEPKIKWFTISNVDEVDDGICKVKTVKAYTYEYTLSKRTFSIEESTLPLYVPPQIRSLVQSNNWVVDKTDTAGIKRNPQIMKTGLLNEILKYLPNWKLGYISSKLLTRYRTIGDTDNANIYPFLMNDAQSLYQCYFVFDGENHTISAYTKEDIQAQSPIYFSWDNVIKELNVTNSDSNYITALRVHTAEDTYGLGLINPTGNDIIYDFSYPKDNKWFDFIADSTKNRKLNDAITSWTQVYNNKLSDYRALGRSLINDTLQEIEISSKLSLALTDYRAKADEINVLIGNDYKDREDGVPLTYIIGDKPRTVTSMQTGSYKPRNGYVNYHSKVLYNELLNLSKNYYEIKASLESIRQNLDITQKKMKAISTELSLSYRTNSYKYTNEDGNEITATPLLSKAERKALDYYIKEGDWTHSNIIFSETYNADDIYNTLVDVYDDAKNDLASRLNKPIFEFSFDMANPFALSEMKNHLSKLRLGHSCNLEIEPNNWVSPTLLSINIDYSKDEETTLSFSTDYKRKPLQNRFADLFGTITQTSVKESVFTFEE